MVASVTIKAQSAFDFVAPLNTSRDRLLDEGWLFYRGDAEGAEAAAYNDKNWRAVSLPHDWSLEPAPVDNSTVAFKPIAGQWRYIVGDNNAYAAVGYDDSTWATVKLPGAIPQVAEKTYYWFRREVTLPPEMTGKDVEFYLGAIVDCDEFFVNGHKIGDTGLMPKNQPQGESYSAFQANRVYRVKAKYLKPGKNLLALCVYSIGKNGSFRFKEDKREIVGPFDSYAVSGDKTGFTLGGTGWYRKHFMISAADRGKKFEVLFGGIYMNSDVWLNGQHLGERPYGYTSFYYDLTPYLKFGGDNVLSVRVRNEGTNSRWYSGSGIYRHVWLTRTEPTHIRRWGVQILTPEASPQAAKVVLNTELEGEFKGANIQVELTDPAGKTVAKGDTATTGLITPLAIDVSNPLLWNLESPHVYTAKVQVVKGGKVVDEVTEAFGIRAISFTAKNGFQLNGKTIKIIGGCLHHDNGLIGAATFDRADFRKMEIMKANGYNAVRASHNPMSDSFYEACDRIGLLVLDEAFDQWTVQKNPQDYGGELYAKWSANDVELWTRRTRNHPSIVLRSFGNEIRFDEKSATEDIACREFTRLKTEALKWDSARPYTTAVVGSEYAMNNYYKFFALQDVVGHNYAEDTFAKHHNLYPDWVQIQTETNPEMKRLVSSWNLLNGPGNDYFTGIFIWSAFEYIGESWSGWVGVKGENVGLPSYAAACGLIDITGYPKLGQRYLNVLAGVSPIELAVLEPLPPGKEYFRKGWSNPLEYPCWDWPEFPGQPLSVRVICRAPDARLTLNGKVVAQGKPAKNRIDFEFKVPYEPGELVAEGLENGKVVATTKISTPGKPVGFRVTSDRSTITTNRNDLAYINVEVVDAKGQLVQTGRYNVSYTVSGAGALEACGNGFHKDVYSFRNPQKRTTYHGRSQAILRPYGKPGNITLTVNSSDLPGATCVVPVTP